MRNILNLGVIALALMIIGCAGEKAEEMSAHGYPYKFIKNVGGEGPGEGDYVLYHYLALIEDSVFNDSHGGIQIPRMQWPSESDVAGNPAPIIDALRMMTPGDSLVIKFSLDSLRKNNPNVPPGDFIDYAITMVDVLSADEYKEYSAKEQARIRSMRDADKARAPEIQQQSLQYLQRMKAGDLSFEKVVTPSGVELYFHKKGKYEPAKKGNAVFTHYYGRLYNSEEEFDDSYSKGIPFRFVYKGRMAVIPAWDEAYAYIPRGSIVSMYIPSELGYGKEGFGNRIGPDEDLYFYIEYLERQK